MKILKFISFCFVGAVLFIVPQSVNAGSTLNIPVNRSELIVVPEMMSEVTVADPKIADVVIHGGTRLSIVGKSIGSTTIRILGSSNEILNDLNVVVGHDLPSIRKRLKELFPDETVGVEMVSNNVAITGVVTDANIAARVVQVVEQYVNGSSSSGSNDSLKKILNLLKLRTGQQVMLQVRVGEIKRTALKSLGINFSAALKNLGNFTAEAATGGMIPNIMGLPDVQSGIIADAFGRANIGFDSNSIGFNSAIEALEKDGLIRLLAEPNLVSVSGEQATFLAGGEIPIPTNNKDGEVTIEYKEYGVNLKFTPYVLAANRIRLIVEPEVSELDYSTTVTVGGVQVPGLRTRKVSTTVELAPGESFMIAGLLHDSSSANISEVPGIAEVPILSSLFRSSSFQRNETELVISVTPYLVDPVVSADIKLPSEDYRAPSMMEQVFYGTMGSLNGNVSRISQTPSLEGPIGLMLD